MNNKFIDLMNQDIRPDVTRHEARLPMEGHCDICRLYNNIWGAATDTRMDITDKGRRVITGGNQLFHDYGFENGWNHLMYAAFWGNVDFRGSGYNCLAEFLYAVHLKPVCDFMNGEQCIQLIEYQPDTENDPMCCTRCCDCCCDCTTNESKIPHRIQVKGSNVKQIAESLGGQWIYDDYNKRLVRPDGSIRVDINEAIIGNKIQNDDLQKLFADNGLENLYMVQNGNKFSLWSDDPSWQRVLNKYKRFNHWEAKSFDAHTPEEWYDQVNSLVGMID